MRHSVLSKYESVSILYYYISLSLFIVHEIPTAAACMETTNRRREKEMEKVARVIGPTLAKP
jgi:hypothetical protein